MTVNTCFHDIYCCSHYVHLTALGLELLKSRNILSEAINLENDEPEDEKSQSTSTPLKAGSPQKPAEKPKAPSSLEAEYKASLPEHVKWLLNWALKTDPETIKSLQVSWY